VTSTGALRIRDLEVGFATRYGLVRSVRGVSIDVEPGKAVGLVGESGSGKSVTTLAALRLLPPAGRILRGSVEFDGVDLARVPLKELNTVRGRRIGMVFQDSMTSLNPLLGIGRQITESLTTHLGVRRSEAQRRAVTLLEEVGVPDPERRLRQYPHQLSGGLRQRVAVAVALAPNPDLLIADEPTTALDVTIQAQLVELLKRQREQRGMSLLLITHDLGVIAGIADEVCVMYAGRIVERGATDEVFGEPRHPYTLGLLHSVPRLDRPLEARLNSIGGSPPVEWDDRDGCAFAARCPSRIAVCSERDPQLESDGAGRSTACFAAVSVRETVSR
jgi:oligopeptide/dipeptide ABC transporter ATP-binding protein